MMKKLEDIIQFGGETDSLDFTGIQYKSATYEDFLKDIIAFANADVDSPRRIICGVKGVPGGPNTLIGFPRSEFNDSADYQQLVRENVEPHMEFTYEPFELNDLTFGVFTIPPHQDRPFMMRKDFGKHKRGDSWIRIGTHRPRLTRPDIDRIFNERSDPFKLANNISLCFEKSQDDKLEIHPVNGINLPSELRAKELNRALVKRQDLDNGAFLLPTPIMSRSEQLEGYFGSSEFTSTSAEDLKKRLESVKVDYLEDDWYELFEARSEKVQLLIQNMGEGFLKDPLVELKIPKGQGIHLAEEIYSKPNRDSRLFTSAIPKFEDPTERINYPSIENRGDHYYVVDGPDKARHKDSTPVFRVPLRMFADHSAVGRQIVIEAKLSAENLKSPISLQLTVNVTEGLSASSPRSLQNAK